MSLSEDFKKPLNIVFLLLAIGGIALSFFFYYNGRKTKSISYQINEPASLIYDSHNPSSSIKVIEQDSTPIRDNVYVLTGVMWNSGDLPISTEDVRQSITLNAPSAKKILECKIVRQTDSEVAKFKLTKVNKNLFVLSWKYFDPGYGFKFLIIYTGSGNSGVAFNGKVLDMHGFNKEINWEHKTILISIFALLYISFCVAALIRAIKNYRQKQLQEYMFAHFGSGRLTQVVSAIIKIIAIFFIVLLLYGIGLMLFSTINIFNNQPPF